jgi:hypothetical protein
MERGMKVKMIDDVVWRDLADEVVILNLASGLYFGLEGTGGRIWHALAELGSTEQAIDLITAEYDADHAQVEQDIERLVAELNDKDCSKLFPIKVPAASHCPWKTFAGRWS